MTDFERDLLKLVGMVNDKLNGMDQRIEETQKICISTSDDLSSLRSRLIEQVSRNDQTSQKQQREIKELDYRVRKLEVS